MYRIKIVDEVFGAGGRGSNGTVLSPDSAVIGRGDRKTIIAEKVESLKIPDDLDVVMGFFIPDTFFSIKDNTTWINRNFPIRSAEDLKVGELEPFSVLRSMSDWTKFLRIYLFLDNTEYYVKTNRDIEKLSSFLLKETEKKYKTLLKEIGVEFKTTEKLTVSHSDLTGEYILSFGRKQLAIVKDDYVEEVKEQVSFLKSIVQKLKNGKLYVLETDLGEENRVEKKEELPIKIEDEEVKTIVKNAGNKIKKVEKTPERSSLKKLRRLFKR